MNVLVITDQAQRCLGLIEERFYSDQIWRIVRETQNYSLPLESMDLVMPLGSDLSLCTGLTSDSARHEARLLKFAIDRGVPVFGICYGAQLLSVVLGGRVKRMPRAEIGWTSVKSSGDAGAYEGEWFQWHYDSFSIPQGAEKLAENSNCPQAFRKGRSVATQFHPEFNEGVFSDWIQSGGRKELSTIGISPSEIIDQTRSRIGDARRRFDHLLEWFLKTV